MERAGTRDTIVVVQRSAPPPSSPAGPLEAWEDVGQFWVSVEARPPEDVTRNEMSMSQEVARFRFDWLDAAEFTRALRIVHDGLAYDIDSIDRSTDTRKTVVILAKASLADGNSMANEVDRKLREGIVLKVVRYTIGAPDIEVRARAMVEQYKLDELVNGINQGDRRITISAADVASLPGGLQDGDGLIMPDGQRLTAMGVDSYTLRIGDRLFAYMLIGRGA